MKNNDEELQHYGIPGMKWGRRKKVPLAGTGKKYADAYKNIYDTKRSNREAIKSLKKSNKESLKRARDNEISVRKKDETK